MYFKYFFIFYKFFMKKSIKKAFTIIELMLVITIIWIIFVMFSSIDFYNLSDKQRWEILANKITSEIETIRNNALIWRIIDDEIIKSWKAEISSSWASVKTYYQNDSGNWIENSKIILDNKSEKISEINCWATVWTWVIIFTGMESSLSWSCTGYNMGVTVKKSEHEIKLNYNSINNLITK